MSDPDYDYYIKHCEELREKYKGQYIAIWNNEVAGHGKTPKDAYDMAEIKYPDAEPLVTFIPENDLDFGL